VAEQWFRFAARRVHDAGDACSIEEIQTVFAREVGREIATPAEVRAAMNLPSGAC
jgi:hypothetical protein